MRAEDLDLKELLELDVGGGLIRFAGQRALIFDAVAQGLLRKELIDSFGVRVARGILSRFGYVHGRRMAEAMRSQFKWDSDEDWRKAGARLYSLQGLFTLEPGRISSLASEGGTWRVSYEAEQHLLHLGRAEYPVCWTLCGLASGYLSFAAAKEVYAIEDRCMGQGDPTCHVRLRSAEEWGAEGGDHLSSFKRVELDAALKEVADALKRTERQLRERSRRLIQVAKVAEDPSDIVARSAEMRRIVDLAKTIAKVDSTVLITGESGTGKERIARFVHEQSACADGPFIAVNCGAISESLLESEFFGHVRGAFTGATADRPGLFEAANGGTLLLDEVGEIPLLMQVKLLRALQEREVRRVGENRSRPINVRIITATNKELGAEVVAKRFREDLYYRLKVVELPVPPLRQRREDILPLARLLLAEAALHMKRPVEGFSAPAADRLLGYSWPGNVRELANVMERAVAVATGRRVDVADLPPEVRLAPPAPVAVGAIRALKDIEREYILATLEASRGNRTRAAKSLGIGVATLHRKLRLYRSSRRIEGIPPKRKSME
ncbi:MAG: sigma-54-dependent Fis family transcriptional regulator [Planctomycetes bacterium]|nr:sigma-54-dependent Fis family transcriptional regulator [Planctomycetota bacterium]